VIEPFETVAEAVQPELEREAQDVGRFLGAASVRLLVVRT
jgi:hypothetical protein